MKIPTRPAAPTGGNWSGYLRNGISAMQSANAAERANPTFAAAARNPLSNQFANVRRAGIPSLGWEVRGSMIGQPTQQERDFAQYRNNQDQSRIVGEFANWYGQNINKTRNPAQLMQIGNQVRNDFLANNLSPYESQFNAFADWKTRDIARQNAGGMLSSGFGAMIPGLAMMAFPAAGLANVATGAAMGGITGGPAGALLGGLSSAVAPRVNLPSGALRAPVQAAANVARQFSNPVTAGRQALASALGSWRRPNA